MKEQSVGESQIPITRRWLLPFLFGAVTAVIGFVQVNRVGGGLWLILWFVAIGLAVALSMDLAYQRKPAAVRTLLVVATTGFTILGLAWLSSQLTDSSPGMLLFVAPGLVLAGAIAAGIVVAERFKVSPPLTRRGVLIGVLVLVLFAEGVAVYLGALNDWSFNTSNEFVASFPSVDHNAEGRRGRVQAVNQDIAAIAQTGVVTEEMIEGLETGDFGVMASQWIDVDDGDRYKIGLSADADGFEEVRDRVQEYIDGLVAEGALLEGDAVIVVFEFGRNEIYAAKAAFAEAFPWDRTGPQVADSMNETTMQLDVYTEEGAHKDVLEFAKGLPDGLVNIIVVETPDPGPDERPVKITEAELDDGELVVWLDACNSETVVTVDETPSEVVVSVIRTDPPPGPLSGIPGCADALYVELLTPLGDRQVVDGSDGEVVQLRGRG